MTFQGSATMEFVQETIHDQAQASFMQSHPDGHVTSIEEWSIMEGGYRVTFDTVETLLQSQNQGKTRTVFKQKVNVCNADRVCSDKGIRVYPKSCTQHQK